jgi:hypothetical protein
MELYDDEPDSFELALKFIYTLDYDKSTIETMAGDNKIKRTLIAQGVYQVADKYDITRLYAPASDDVLATLKSTPDSKFEILRKVIRSHYETCSGTDTPMGKAIISVMLEDRRNFMREEDFEVIMQSFPAFTVDIALNHKREGMFNVRKAVCSCKSITLIDTSPYPSYYSTTSVNCRSCNKRMCV